MAKPSKNTILNCRCKGIKEYCRALVPNFDKSEYIQMKVILKHSRTDELFVRIIEYKNFESKKIH